MPARPAGELRDDVDAADVLRLCAFLWSGRAAAGWPLGSERLLEVVLDGLTPPAGRR